MTRAEVAHRLEEAAERSARLVVAFRRLATTYHATHASEGIWLTCSHPQCAANADALSKWRAVGSVAEKV
jgi:hypothetical protein